MPTPPTPTPPKVYRLQRQGQNAKLTLEQTREVRLSMEPTKAASERLGVSVGTILKCRTGENYGQLMPDEKDAQERRFKREKGTFVLQDYLLTFGPHYLPGLADQDLVEALDANNECQHGRLPTDRSAPCGCWPQEALKTSPNPIEGDTHVRNPEHRQRLQRLTAQVARSGHHSGSQPADRPAVATGDR